MESTRSPRPDGPTHAGGIVYRGPAGAREYLLVRARAAREWVFPKGHIEPDETAEQAAVREVHEEAGVRARIVASLATLHLHAGSAAMFLMSLDSVAGQAERETTWLDPARAVEALTFEESRALLRSADSLLRSS